MKKLLIVLIFLSIYSTAQTYHAVMYNGTNASSQDKLLALTIAGIVNRDSARLYLLNVYETWSYNQTDEKWRDVYRTSGRVIFDSVSLVSDLVNRFRSFINGGISYDPNRYFSNFSGQSFRWQAEVAATIGGLTNRLPVTTTMAGQLNLTLTDSVLINDSFDGDSSVWVTGKLEVASHPWNNISLNEEQRYLLLLNWGLTKLLPRCNPSKFYIREITDFTVQQKMFQVNLAGTGDLDLNSMPTARADILENILNYMHSKNSNSIFHIYGWIRPEPMTQWFAHFGSSFHETLLGNLSWHSSFPIASRTFIPKSLVNPDTITLENKYYIIFIGTEGDASNWNFSFQSGAWLSNQRGTVPIAWGWNLHLLNLCPFVAAYYYDSGTKNDGFLSVTSPLGYAYPDLWGNEVWNKAVDSSRYLMNKLNVENLYGYKHYAGSGTMVFRGKVINNSFNFPKYGQFNADIGAKLTMLFDPQLPVQTPVTNYGGLLFNHCDDGSFYGDASNLNTMANRIISNLSGKPKPYFLIAGYQRFRMDDFSNRSDPSNVDINIPRLNQVVALIKANSSVGQSVEVVTPEKFSVVMRKKLGLIKVENEAPTSVSFILEQNYPNPFNPNTTIIFNVSVLSHVTLIIYDVLGKEIAILVDEDKLPGRYKVEFSSMQLKNHKLISGVYYYQIKVGENIETKKMLYIK
jgi:hypothetical protein